MSEKTQALLEAVRNLITTLQAINNNDDGLTADELSFIAGNALDDYDEAARNF